MQQISLSHSLLIQAFENNESIVITYDHQWYTRSKIITFLRKLIGLHTSDMALAGRRIAKYIQLQPIENQNEHNIGLRFSDAEALNMQQLLISVQKSIIYLNQSKIDHLKKFEDKKRAEQKDSKQRDALRKKIAAFKKKEISLFTTLSEILRAKNSVIYLSKTQESHAEDSSSLDKKNSSFMEEVIEADDPWIDENNDVLKQQENLSKNALEIVSAKSVEDQNGRADDIIWLRKKIDSFQKRQKMALLRPESTNSLDKKIIRACCYPEFIEAIRQNWVLRESFIKMVCRGSAHGSVDSIDCFIQIPYIQDCLKRSFLDKRLQRIANDGLKVVQKGDKKEVQLLIHGMHQSISYLPGSVTIKKNTTCTVEEIFKKFQKINDAIIDIEYIQTGIEQLDFRLEQFDFTKKEWWNDLPIIEEVSIDIAQKRFPGRDLKNEKLPLVSIHATRETEDLSPSGTHGFIDLYIPIPEKPGVYNLISPGKYGDSFLAALNQGPISFSPRGIKNLIGSVINSVQMIFSTQKGIYFLADQNNYMSHRYHKEIPLPQLTEKQLEITMDFIKDMFISAKERKMIFQAQGDNCTAPFAELFNRLYPNSNTSPFVVSFLDIQSPPSLKWIQKVEKICLKKSHWNRFRVLLSTLFGAKKAVAHKDADGKDITSSLSDNPDWKNDKLHLPANIFKSEVVNTFLDSIKQTDGAN
ncbi:MAG: hypothetical protein QRY74_00520 [Chlamydia sp.]